MAMEIIREFAPDRAYYHCENDAVILKARFTPMLYGSGFGVCAAMEHRFDGFKVSPITPEWRPNTDAAEVCALQLMARLAMSQSEFLHFEEEEIEPYVAPDRYAHMVLINARAQGLYRSTYPRRKYWGSVYLMKSTDGLYKIGRAAFPDSRKRTLERELGVQITLEHEIPAEDPGHAEYWFHQVFALKRVHLEWFALVEYDVEWIKMFSKWPYQGEQK